MEDPELIALNKLKGDLIAKAYSLIEKLKEQDSEEQVVISKLLYHIIILFYIIYHLLEILTFIILTSDYQIL